MNMIFILTGILGLALLALSIGRQLSWTLDTSAWGVVQHVLHGTCWVTFIGGCIVEVAR
jgi:hypothetical protein